jgi:hypothetical protein
VDGYNAVYAADTSADGAFVRLSSAQGRKTGPFATTADHAFIAFLDGDAAGAGKAAVAVTTPSGNSKTPFASGRRHRESDASGVSVEQRPASWDVPLDVQCFLSEFEVKDTPRQPMLDM